MPKTKIDKLKDLKVGKSTFGEVLGAVLKVKPPAKKKAKRKPKKL